MPGCDAFLLMFTTHRNSMFSSILSICVVFISITMLSLCSKKKKAAPGSYPPMKAGSTRMGAAPPTKSVKTASNVNSPAPPPFPTTPAEGTPSKKEVKRSAEKLKPPSAEKVKPSKERMKRSAEKMKPSAEKVTDDGGGTRDVVSKEDTFDNHKPIAREAKRTAEIKKRGPVDNKRKDYKTLRRDLPSSDFDKSLGLPEVDENKHKK